MDAPGGDFDLSVAAGTCRWFDRARSAQTIRCDLSSMLYSGAAGKANDAPKAPAKDALILFCCRRSLGRRSFCDEFGASRNPDPITKVTWDNVAMMSPKTAAELGIEKPSQIGHTATERVEITAEVGGKEATLNIPAWIVPGMPITPWRSQSDTVETSTAICPTTNRQDRGVGL